MQGLHLQTLRQRCPTNHKPSYAGPRKVRLRQPCAATGATSAVRRDSLRSTAQLKNRGYRDAADKVLSDYMASIMLEVAEATGSDVRAARLRDSVEKKVREWLTEFEEDIASGLEHYLVILLDWILGHASPDQWEAVWGAVRKYSSYLVGRGPVISPYSLSNHAPVPLNPPEQHTGVTQGNGVGNCVGALLCHYSYSSNYLQPMQGSIPEELEGGVFLALGPNPVYRHQDQHWFDGDGMMHACCFSKRREGDGELLGAYYTRSLVETQRLLHELSAGQPLYPRMGLMHGFQTIPYMMGVISGLILNPIPGHEKMLAGIKMRRGRKEQRVENLLEYLRNAVGYLTANTAPFVQGSSLYALHDLDMPYELEVQEVRAAAGGELQKVRLRTVGRVPVGKAESEKPGAAKFSSVLGDIHQQFAAHPKYVGDGKGGSYLAAFTYNGTRVIGSPQYRLRLFDSNKPLGKSISDISIDFPPYEEEGEPPGQTLVHDLAATESHIVFVNSPLSVSMEEVLTKDMLSYVLQDQPICLGVMAAQDALDPPQGLPAQAPTPVTWYPAELDGEPFKGVMQHIAEAWEEEGEEGQLERLHVVGMVLPDTFDLQRMVVGAPAKLYEFIVPVIGEGAAARKATARLVCSPDTPFSSAARGECPVTSLVPASRQQGCFSRSSFVFMGCSASFLGVEVFDGITKVNMLEGRVAGKITYGPLRFASGQPTFVPKNTPQLPGINEDDGYLIAFVYDASQDHTAHLGLPQGSSELLIYDAKTMDSTPLARVPLGVRVPYGFHAHFARDLVKPAASSSASTARGAAQNLRTAANGVSDRRTEQLKVAFSDLQAAQAACQDLTTRLRDAVASMAEENGTQ